MGIRSDRKCKAEQPLAVLSGNCSLAMPSIPMSSGLIRAGHMKGSPRGDKTTKTTPITYKPVGSTNHQMRDSYQTNKRVAAPQTHNTQFKAHGVNQVNDGQHQATATVDEERAPVRKQTDEAEEDVTWRHLMEIQNQTGEQRLNIGVKQDMACIAHV